MPNGGGAVVARATWLSGLLLLAYIALASKLEPNSTWQFCGPCFRALLRENLTLGGAIFAGAYAALYARFASQWTYLADLYNQIMATQVATGQADPIQQAKLSMWKAGFIEDAVAVHLATKPMYASVIVSMLSDNSVREAYVNTTAAGVSGLTKLETRLKSVLGAEVVKRLQAAPIPKADDKQG
jgi:hypothetical protein